MVTVAVPFAPMPRDQNPNLRKRGRGDVYLRSAYVTFASLSRWNPSVELTFVTNVAPDQFWIDSYRELGVTITRVPFNHAPPEGFSDSFVGSFYLLDAVFELDSDYLLLVDPDVVCVGDITPLTEERSAVAAILIPSPPTLEINGLRPADARKIEARLDGRPSEALEPPRHLGGELYGIPRSLIEATRERIKIGWDETVRAWTAQEPHFRTEEHVMNYALARIPVAEASAYARRVWTAHGYRTVLGDEGSLALWHLPSEKERGLAEIYAAARDETSWFWTADRPDFSQRVGAACGVHGRSIKRLAIDLIAHARRALA